MASNGLEIGVAQGPSAAKVPADWLKTEGGEMLRIMAQSMQNGLLLGCVLLWVGCGKPLAEKVEPVSAAVVEAPKVEQPVVSKEPRAAEAAPAAKSDGEPEGDLADEKSIE